MVPQPEIRLTPATGDTGGSQNREVLGLIYFGTSTFSAEEAIDRLQAEGSRVDAMRVRAFPFGKAFQDFVASHERIYVIEQNRDAQFKSLMMIELGIDPHKLISILNYDGTPITAEDILSQIVERGEQNKASERS